jgi:uncharacterized protein (DUF4213/DUF364 family)
MEQPARRRLLERVEDSAPAFTIDDVQLGAKYCGVRLDDGSAGVAFNFGETPQDDKPLFGGITDFQGLPATELLKFVESSQTLEAAVGLAALNALLNRHRPEFFGGDVLELAQIRQTDRVGMVGYFAPIMERLNKMSGEVLVFEKNLARADGLLPESEAAKLLPECQVALLTATSLINHTFEGLLEGVRLCREVVILGSSTPMCRRAFADTPVTLLSGIVIDEPDRLMRVVGEGGGTRRFKGLVSKVNCRLK